MINQLVRTFIGQQYNLIDSNPEQFSNTCLPRYITEFGIIIDVNLLQSIKEQSSIYSTELGIETEVNPAQPKKASILI